MKGMSKVLLGLKCCSLGDDCDECPYTEERCREHLCGDAYHLLGPLENENSKLKEQLNAANQAIDVLKGKVRNLGGEL